MLEIRSLLMWLKIGIRSLRVKDMGGLFKIQILNRGLRLGLKMGLNLIPSRRTLFELGLTPLWTLFDLGLALKCLD